MQNVETLLPPLPPMSDIGNGKFEYVGDIYERGMLQNAFKAIQLAEAWDYVRRDPGKGGFMYSSNPLSYKIMEKMEQCEPSVGHSGASYGCVMRNMQYLAQHGIKKHREIYIGDGKFEYVSDIDKRNMLENAFKAIEMADVWQDVIENPIEDEFMFSTKPDTYYKIMESMDRCQPSIGQHNHESYKYVMSNMQSLAIYGVKKHKERYI